ncbi:Malonyl CoA-acyl carrier protein transacylase [hydrothermal vent metagenome]|uniref:[acyl-carrier-protein] S-malonyltransferase n=1 Tax=hydrothermal vent metagenome TaxID=652676 RepID=A0A3B1AAP8_9ZZZZ
MSFSIVFPGQGSQSVAMLSGLADEFPIVKETFAQASDVLEYDLWALVKEGPIEKLNETTVTQPAMLASGIACWRVWQQQESKMPASFAGHSLGEYTALVATNSLQFTDAIKLVAERARLMQEAVPVGIGAMAAILGLDNELVIKVCIDSAQGEIVSAVNFNSLGQVVIAGNKTAVDRAIVLAKDAGAKRALLLPVSVPSHCALMKPAADKLAEVLTSIEIKTPDTPVIHNVDVQHYTEAEKIKNALTNQLHQPVQWVDCVNAIAKSGSTKMIECGPGKVLTGLVKRINKSLSCVALYDKDSLDKAKAFINE